ncbi:MAG: hypothetical protein Ta2E_07930 [Mycoplasmoidaceae bacterium]|nr:MAG: hypothetical protein Ta2E_07930 [Mycoplasmoidaceae bacterium]
MFKKQDKYLSKQKKLLVRACLLSLAVLLGVSSACLVYYLVKLDNGTKISLNQITGPDKLDKKGDRIVYEAKVKNPKGVTTWKEPTPVDGVSVNYSNDGEHDLIIATALVDMQYEPSIDIAATNNKKTASASIASSYVSFNPLPITSDFFTFDRTDTNNDTVVGFSSAVINNPSILADSEYNSLDFTNTNIKYVDASASFPENILTQWGVEKMSFSGLKFKFKLDPSIPAVVSGSQMFYQYNFPSLIELDLSYTDFASAIEKDFNNKNTDLAIHTGYQMFYDCYFQKLHTLKINNAIFASNEMQAPTTDDTKTADIFTGSEMFKSNSPGIFPTPMFKKLAFLDMSNAIFAADGMGCGNVYTGNDMFYKTKMNELFSLKLNDTIFAAKAMSKYTGSAQDYDISTAFKTFELSEMVNLKELNLSTTVFSTERMMDETNLNYSNNCLYTARKTFANSNLSGLQTLDLSNTEFASSNNYGAKSGYLVAYETFSEANLSSVTSLNLVNTKFAAENMFISDRDDVMIYQCTSFFQSADLSSLKTLDLSKAIFAVENTTTANLITGASMFTKTKLYSLTTLDLSNTTLLVPNMCVGSMNKLVMYNMFDGVYAYNVKDIYLPSTASFDSTYEFKNTFEGWGNFPEIGTIHWEDYNYIDPSSYPVNWDSNWFNSWYWTNI